MLEGMEFTTLYDSYDWDDLAGRFNFVHIDVYILFCMIPVNLLPSFLQTLHRELMGSRYRVDGLQ